MRHKADGFVHAVADVGRRADVSDEDKQQLKLVAEQIGKQLKAVADMAR
jgi:hypothetical protein